MFGVELWLLHHLIGLALAAPMVTVGVALLAMATLVDWFRSRSEIAARDADVLAFSISTALASGAYQVQGGVFDTKVVQGFYNRRTDKIVESRTIEPKRVAPDVAALHEKALVVWT
jgi:hypothetical protein